MAYINGNEILFSPTINYSDIVYLLPEEVATELEMEMLLKNATVGTVCKYVGESGTYENGAYYVVESE